MFVTALLAHGRQNPQVEARYVSAYRRDVQVAKESSITGSGAKQKSA